MERIHKNLLTKNECQEIIALISSETLSEKIKTLTGAEITRTYINEQWGYTFTRLGPPEAQKYIDKINNIFPDYTVVSLRTLRYPYKAHMGQHTDAPLPAEGNSNAGLIIQLTDPKMYKGGGLFMGNELIELEQGDSALYSYTTPHRVTQILKGIRIVCNVRLLKNG